MAATIYDKVIEQVRSGQVAPVYVMAGGDAFLEDFLISQVTEQFLPAGERKKVLSLDDDRSEDLLAELNAYGLFQTRQVLVARQTQRITGKARDELLQYAASPNEDKCLMLLFEEHQPRKGLQKSLAKAAVVVDTRPPFPDKLRMWAGYYAKLKGYSLEPAALDQLMEAAGDSAGHVTSELEKIFSQLPDGELVTRQLVEEQVGMNRTFKPWQLQEAVARRQSGKALAIAVSLLEYGAVATQLVAGLGALFNQLLFMQSGTVSKETYTGLNKPVSMALSAMAGAYSPGETARCLRLLLAADVRLKTESVDPGVVVVALIASLCRKNR
ncbi:MAG: DNA polymerase III subunit delta [Candidatus Marinimicrobia bacterium]|nr:DNA polymerase III subunit delta [Candidatus Neomarinimicrobiota bacterium]